MLLTKRASTARIIDINERLILPFARETYPFHKPNHQYTHSDHARRVTRDLDLHHDEELRLSKAIQIDAHRTKLKLQEYYRGIPVYGSSLVTDIYDGVMTNKVSGHIAEGISNDLDGVEVEIAPEKAVAIAVQTKQEIFSRTLQIFCST